MYSDALKIAMRYTSCTADAKDVLNKAMLKVFTKIDQFKGGPDNFFGWVKRIIINQALDELKSKNFRQSFDPMENIQSDPSTDGITDQYNYESIVHLIQRLPTTSACVFNLFAIEGYSHKEIGDSLGITPENSRYHLRAARKQLQTWIFKTEKI